MMQGLKELIVILALTTPIWFFSKRLFAHLSAPGDFERRRNVWVFLTVLGLLSPNIWIYTFAALPVMYWGGRRDSNPIALYVLLFYVIPNVTIPLPSIVINQLFEINNQRLLAFAIVLPAALKARRLRFSEPGRLPGPSRRLDIADWLLIGYLILTVILPIPYEAVTNTLRRAFLTVLDVGLLFAVWSRVQPRYEVFRDCLGAWVVAAVMMAAVAIFETARGWLLYVPISMRWGNPNGFAFLMRGDYLRAQASAEHSLTLGIWLAIAWAFFLFIQSSWKSKLARGFFALILLGGLAASMARGAWIATMFATVVYILMGSKGIGSAAKSLSGLVIVLGIVLITPLGDKIVNMLPFIGTVDTENVDYRKQLFEVSIGLIEENPWFGSPFVLNEMESLRQGQGIIDLVNGYLTVALFNGLVGLALFSTFLLVAVKRGFSVWSTFRRKDLEHARLGAALVAAMLGTMLFIATAGVDPMTYMLAGLLSSYWWAFSRTKGLALYESGRRQQGAKPIVLETPSNPPSKAHTGREPGRRSHREGGSIKQSRKT
ncbi:hypothetical protein LPB72_10755 [Hydrogenophaga crassostreae]|uniref:O-antigen ligase-related domain-containing protein n=1 Tax=Hydrogenophaga crassostreae TaxID=1763535 RepID=A0A162P6D3_9BURK|nr:O-antigen ligase family protein [Hydrogenophaga crassostreae]AOW13493.1 hypothetical protein LPB072_12130 [Hydrogenophaga crassostreae]OAD41784.1 hypothetical protein LPB72_10755 [Hydrogenophaga crassostreae]